MDWGQNILALGFLDINLAFLVLRKLHVTSVWPKLENAAPILNPYSKTQINQTDKKFRGQVPAGPAGDGKTQVMLAKCSMSECGHF